MLKVVLKVVLKVKTLNVFMESKNLIESFQELHISQEDTISKLIEKYTLSEGDAMSYVSQYWK